MKKKQPWEIASEALIGQEITWLIDYVPVTDPTGRRFCGEMPAYARGHIIGVKKGTLSIQIERDETKKHDPGTVKRISKKLLIQWGTLSEAMAAAIAASMPPVTEVAVADDDPHVIYKLIDPLDDSIRYVGLTTNVERRYLEHISCSGTNLKKNLWMTELHYWHILPDLRIIERIRGRKAALTREAYWINYYLTQGEPLTNIMEVAA